MGSRTKVARGNYSLMTMEQSYRSADARGDCQVIGVMDGRKKRLQIVATRGPADARGGRVHNLYGSAPTKTSQGELRSALLNLPRLLPATFPVVLKDEADFVALVEGLNAGLLEGGGVNKNVFRAILRCDEAKALG
jgi:hypothetical protein